MRHSRIAVALLVVCGVAPGILAQDRKPLAKEEQSQFVVSAKAGIVSFVDGDGTLLRFRPFAMPEALISGDELAKGDTVKTVTGRTEILLNPGCYLRLGENSEFVFQFHELLYRSRDEIKLVRGSAVIETSVSELPLVVTTPSGTFTIIRNGLYRFNIGEGRAEAFVRKGRILVGNALVKEGKRVTLERNSTVLASFDKKAGDGFDDWSKERARTLIATNRSLSKKAVKRTVEQALVRGNVWLFDPQCGCYTFLPFTLGFSSPYGWGYSRCNPYWYLAPWYYGGSDGGGYSGPRQPGSYPSGGGSGGGYHPPSGGGSGPPIYSPGPAYGSPTGSGIDRAVPTPRGSGGGGMGPTGRRP